MQLRPYQSELLQAARQAYKQGHRRILIQLATGGGKTVILSDLSKTAISKHSVVSAIVHRRELVDQIVSTLTTFGLSPDIIAAGVNTTSSQTRLFVAMQQTLARRVDQVDAPNILIVDEAHHQAAAGYQKIAEAWPDTMIVGFTATPCRLDGKPLKEYFDTLICGPTVSELIDLGALAEYVYLAPPMDPKLMKDLKGLKKRGGDYEKKGLQLAVNSKKIVGDVIEHYRQHFNGKPVIAFCAGVDHAKMVASEFTFAGFRAASVDGSMKDDERSDVIDQFRRGLLSVLTSCDLIGEGFDVPNCQGALLLRPTASLTIFMQQCGRALRPKDDGSKAIILDHVGNCYRHGRPADPREWSLEGKLPKNEVKITQCPKCFVVLDPVTMDLSGGCPSGVYPDDCAFLAAQAAGNERETELVHVDGELVEYVPPVNRDWAGKIDIRTAEGKDYARLLRIAGGDIEKLKEIQRIRNYKRGWAERRIQMREAGIAKFRPRS